MKKDAGRRSAPMIICRRSVRFPLLVYIIFIFSFILSLDIFSALSLPRISFLVYHFFSRSTNRLSFTTNRHKYCRTDLPRMNERRVDEMRMN